MMTRAAYLGTTAWICDGDRQFFFLGGVSKVWCEWLGLSFKVIVGSGCGSDCILEGNIGTALFFSGFLFFLFFFSFFPLRCASVVSLCLKH